MADDPSAPAGTSSTPPPAADPPKTAPAASAAPTPPPPADPVKPADPPKASDPAPPPPEAKPPEPLFALPEDFKPPESALTKFSEHLTKATVDGKLTLTHQQVADMYVEMARDANTFYEAEIARVNTQNEAACKTGFSAEELTAAETAVGWVTSRFDQTFRDDFAKRQLNDPRFTRLMVLIHDAYLSEDTFEPAGRIGASGPDKRPLLERAQEKLYGGKSN